MADLILVRPMNIPLGPKLVLAMQMIGLAFSVFWAFTLLRVGDTIGIVIQSAIFIGLTHARRSRG